MRVRVPPGAPIRTNGTLLYPRRPANVTYATSRCHDIDCLPQRNYNVQLLHTRTIGVALRLIHAIGVGRNHFLVPFYKYGELAHVGRAPALQAGGDGIVAHILHH